MVKVVWTKTALDQFEKIIKYLENERGKTVAKVVGSRIIERAGQLEQFPNSGTIEPLLLHKRSEYRFLVVWSYKIIYRSTHKRVVISRIFHTSQNPKKLRN